MKRSRHESVEALDKVANQVRSALKLRPTELPHVPCGERRIKVGRTFYSRRPASPTAYHVSTPVPWIQLKGHWLGRAGFTINAKIRVRVMRGCLVLTVDEA